MVRGIPPFHYIKYNNEGGRTLDLLSRFLIIL